MAKKAAKAKTSSSQVVVKVTGGALPSSLCFVAGRLIARAQGAIDSVYTTHVGKAYPLRQKSALVDAALALQAIRENFPLTKEKISPIEQNLAKLVKGKNVPIGDMVKQAARELAILERKARQGCNVK